MDEEDNYLNPSQGLSPGIASGMPGPSQPIRIPEGHPSYNLPSLQRKKRGKHK